MSMTEEEKLIALETALLSVITDRSSYDADLFITTVTGLSVCRDEIMKGMRNNA